MKINISFPWDLPEKLSGPAVVIDVNCASHNIAYLLTKSAELYLATQENANFALLEIADALFMGESDDPELKKKFVSNNDAVSVVKTYVTDNNVILLTFNGTQSIKEALDKGADPVIAASYPNFHTLADYLINLDPPNITLIPAGGREKMYAPNHNLLEDLLCAEMMKTFLSGGVPDFEEAFRKSKEYIINNSRDINFNYDERFTLIFTDHDTYPVIPVCRKLSNGLIKVSNTMIDDYE
jgi:phosphosulfolactate phosphohydrolase-like enzyme